MSDALYGVIIGGIIGSIAPFSTLLFGYYRWKREAKLEYLKAERIRLEGLFEKVLKQFANGMKENSYSSDMSSDLAVLVPSEVYDEFVKFISDEEKTDLKCKHAYLGLAIAMKKQLAAIDIEIKELVS